MTKEDRIKTIKEIIDRVENFKGDTRNEVACERFSNLCSLLKNTADVYNSEYHITNFAELVIVQPEPNSRNSMAYLNFPEKFAGLDGRALMNLGLALSIADDFVVSALGYGIRLSLGVQNTYINSEENK